MTKGNTEGSDFRARVEEIRSLETELFRLKRLLLESTALSSEQAESADDLTFLMVRSGGRDFALPIAHVEEVVQMVEINAATEETWGVRGLLDFHGHLMTVLDIGEMIGSGRTEILPDKMMVICDLEPFKFAIIVDETADVVTAPRSEIKILDEVLPGALKDMGLLQALGRNAVILDLWSAVLSVQARRLGSEVPAPSLDETAEREGEE